MLLLNPLFLLYASREYSLATFLYKRDAVEHWITELITRVFEWRGPLYKDRYHRRGALLVCGVAHLLVAQGWRSDHRCFSNLSLRYLSFLAVLPLPLTSHSLLCLYPAAVARCFPLCCSLCCCALCAPRFHSTLVLCTLLIRSSACIPLRLPVCVQSFALIASDVD